MGRPARLKPANGPATFHVMTRTAHQSFFLKDAAIKEYIYNLAKWLRAVYYVRLHAVTILDNHYHLVLTVERPALNVPELKRRFERFQSQKRIPQQWYSWRSEEWHRRLTDLSYFMRDFNRSISVFVNRRRRRVGSIWGERFKSVLIEDGAGMLACLVYVELNCVRAGLVERPCDYRWCSVGRYEQGGRRAAGVEIPALTSFGRIQSGASRQRAFALLVDHVAGLERQGKATYPRTVEAIQKIVTDVDVDDLVALTLRKTRWLLHSAVLGSEGFCRRMIDEFGLQPGRFSDAKPYRLSINLFNAHVRAGPHAN